MLDSMYSSHISLAFHSHSNFSPHSSQLKYFLAFVSLIKHHDSLESFH